MHMGCDFTCVSVGLEANAISRSLDSSHSLEKNDAECALVESKWRVKNWASRSRRTKWGCAAELSLADRHQHHQISRSQRERIHARTQQADAIECMCVYNAVCGAYMPAVGWVVGLHQTIAIIPSELLFIKKTRLHPSSLSPFRPLAGCSDACTGELELSWLHSRMCIASLPAGMYACDGATTETCIIARPSLRLTVALAVGLEF
jgi:hypothetical protein